MATPNPLRLLFVETIPSDWILAESILQKAGIPFTSSRATTEQSFLTALETFNPDVIIANIVKTDPLVLTALKHIHSTTPFIILSDSTDAAFAIACMKNGASDFLTGDDVEKLPAAITEALAKNRSLAAERVSVTALREREKLFRTLMASMQDIVFTLDRDQRHTGVYGRWVEKGGLKPADFLGKTPAEILGEEAAKVHNEANLRALAGEFVIYDWSNRTESMTRHFQTALSPIYNNEGVVEEILGEGRDITERKLVEKALLESEFLLRESQYIAHLGSYILDIPSGYWRSSSVMDEIFGIDESYFRSLEGWSNLIHPEDREMMTNYFANEVVGQKKEFDKEYRIISPQNNFVRWVHGLGILEFDEKGDPVGMHGTIQDITERKLAAEEKEFLEHQIHHLQKEESLGRMAGAIAHRFNNLLQGIQGNLELALNQVSNGEAFDYLTDAIGTAHKASEISRLMLTYLGQNSGQREMIDLADACRRYLPLLQMTIPKEIVLITNLPSPGPTIKSNVTQIQQVLSNLITNAWEAIGAEEGEIRLTVDTVPAGMTLSGHRFPIDWQPQAASYACIEVIDTGTGIADDDFDKILDPFFSTKFTGRGLGLAAVLGIVRSNGGVMTIESQLGLGSTFRIFTPLAIEPAKALESATPPAGIIAGRQTVLLVEDEDQVRDLTTIMLEHLEYNVLSASNGVEALELFRQHQDAIDCVLCDLVMPRMNGWLTLAALRETKKGLPVILVSGYDEDQVMEGEHPEMPQAILGKPFDLQALQDVIERVMGGGK